MGNVFVIGRGDKPLISLPKVRPWHLLAGMPGPRLGCLLTSNCEHAIRSIASFEMDMLKRSTLSLNGRIKMQSVNRWNFISQGKGVALSILQEAAKRHGSTT